jgi:hypothetical protein
MATPGNFGGEAQAQAQARARFSGHNENEGAIKCTGARAHLEPCAAKPEPPGHKARESAQAKQTHCGVKLRLV